MVGVMLAQSGKSRLMRRPGKRAPVRSGCRTAGTVPYDRAFVRYGHHVLVLSAAAAARACIRLAMCLRGDAFVTLCCIHCGQYNDKSRERKPSKQIVYDVGVHRNGY